MLRITSANLNGIRSAARKDFFTWFLAQSIDVLCIQETKAQKHQLGPEIAELPGYSAYFLDAVKPGYSGVAIYTRKKALTFAAGIGLEDLDGEGRYLRLDFERVSIVSIYVPSGTSGPHRQAAKERYLERLATVMQEIRISGRSYIICGDLNIAHKTIDLKNWRANQQTPGFLPHERAWLDTLFDEIGMVDAFRALDQRPEQYTWWSMRSGARAKNVGWRIDYQIITPDLVDALAAVEIVNEPIFSDHAPLTIDYRLVL